MAKKRPFKIRKRLCVPKTSSRLRARANRLPSNAMFALMWIVLAALAFPFKSKSGLEAENAILRSARDGHKLALRAMGIRDRPIAPGSPWQNGIVERLIGSIRRECLDHVLIFSEVHLRRILREYGRYSQHSADTSIAEKGRAYFSCRATGRRNSFSIHLRRPASPISSGLGFRYTQAF